MRCWSHRESCACPETPAVITGEKPMCTTYAHWDSVKMLRACAIKSGPKVPLEQLILS